MTEKFTYSYLDVIDSTVNLCSQMYHNIDAYTTSINVGSTTVIMQQEQKFTLTGRSTGTLSGRNVSGAGRMDPGKPVPSGHSDGQTSRTATLTAKIYTSNKKPAIVSSSEIRSFFETNSKTVCEYEASTDKVTAKGLLAYMNLLTWFLKQGTIAVQFSSTSSTGYACLEMPSFDNYKGLKKGSDEVIKKADFDSLSWLIGEVASKTSYYSDAATYALSGSSSSSSCSSSCSSSSCSSSCSSSSSSSCSSSSSSAFIAYMKLA